MRSPIKNRLVSVLGALLSIVGFLLWVRLGWEAVSGIEDASPQSTEGGRLMAWALGGTLLMVAGMIVLHVAVADPEQEAEEPPAS